MSDSFETGDLVTGRQKWRPGFIGATLTARPAGGAYWTLRLPLDSIMTVAEDVKLLYRDEQKLVTVLHDGRLIEVFFDDVERVGETDVR